MLETHELDVHVCTFCDEAYILLSSLPIARYAAHLLVICVCYLQTTYDYGVVSVTQII